jgi:chromosome segregation ATPase
MANALKKVAGVFFNGFDEQPEVPPTAPVTTPRPGNAGYHRVSALTPKSSVNEEMRAQILSELDKATPDELTEFLNTVASLEGTIPDEAARYKAALITSKINSATLIEAARTRHSALAGVAKTFEKELVAAQKGLEADKLQVQQIDEQIQALTQQKEQLEKTIDQNATSINEQQGSFNATQSSIEEELTNMEETLSSYISTIPQKGPARGRNNK